MESGRAPAHSATEPGRVTVQLLVACSAVLAVLQLVAATSVRVFNGDRAGWWIAIQGATVTFSAAFAGAAAGANGAWYRRLRDHSPSTTPKSIVTGIGVAGVAAMVFGMLCWAAIAQHGITAPVSFAVLLASLAGGVAGSLRAGGAVLGGLVAVFFTILIDLAGQALLTTLVLTPSLSSQDEGQRATLYVTVAALTQLVASVVGTVAGCWWLARRRQHTGIYHCLIVGLFGSALLLIANLTAGLALLLVPDQARGAAFGGSLPTHGLQFAAAVLGGTSTAVVMGYRLPRRPRHVRPLVGPESTGRFAGSVETTTRPGREPSDPSTAPAAPS